MCVLQKGNESSRRYSWGGQINKNKYSEHLTVAAAEKGRFPIWKDRQNDLQRQQQLINEGTVNKHKKVRVVYLVAGSSS